MTLRIFSVVDAVLIIGAIIGSIVMYFHSGLVVGLLMFIAAIMLMVLNQMIKILTCLRGSLELLSRYIPILKKLEERMNR